MLNALKINQQIDKYSIQLLKYSLLKDDQDYWKLYDQLISTLGYTRLIISNQISIIKSYQNKIYQQYSSYTQNKLLQLDLLQTVSMKRFWKQQIINYNHLQYPNSIYCILTPLNYTLQSQINKINDYNLSSYAFVFKDYVLYSNKIASAKGIIKGLPNLLIKKIDIDTKVIQLNRFSYTKFQEIYHIFKQKYKYLNSTLKGQQIHFTLNQQQSNNSNLKEILKSRIQNIIQDIHQISNIRLHGFVSKNQIICNMLIKNTPSYIIQSKHIEPIILLEKQQIKNSLLKTKISSVPGMCLTKINFLNQMNIKTIQELLQNLHTLEMMTSSQQTHITLECCLGIDHRQNQDYINAKRKQFQSLGINYDKLFPISQQNKLQGLKRQQKRQNRIKQVFDQQDFDQVKSQKINSINNKNIPQFNPKSQKNVPGKQPPKQQYFPMFGKKTKK